MSKKEIIPKKIPCTHCKQINRLDEIGSYIIINTLDNGARLYKYCTCGKSLFIAKLTTE